MAPSFLNFQKFPGSDFQIKIALFPWLIMKKEEVLMLNKINKATIITSISLTTGLVFWAGVWIAKQVYWEIMGYK